MGSSPGNGDDGGPDDAGKTKADLHAEQFSIASLAPPAAAARPAAALDFFGPFPTLGALLAATPGVLRADELQRRAVVPVCYGGTFAAVWISLSA